MEWFSCPQKSADKTVEPWHTADFIVGNIVRYQLASRIQSAKWYNKHHRVMNKLNKYSSPTANNHHGDWYPKSWPLSSSRTERILCWTIKSNDCISGQKSADYLAPIIGRPIIDQSIICAPLPLIDVSQITSSAINRHHLRPQSVLASRGTFDK